MESSLVPVLVIAHQAPCRALRAYLLGLPLAEAMGAASSPGSAALADGACAMLTLAPTQKWYEFEEIIEPLPLIGEAVGGAGDSGDENDDGLRRAADSLLSCAGGWYS